MAGEVGAIWEVQASAANGTEATATTTHTQLFNSTTKVIGDGGAFIEDKSVQFGSAIPENPSVNSDSVKIQDMGITGVHVTITGIAGNTNNDAATNLVNKFIKWRKDGNTTTLFTEGRFGLRLDNAPQWNVVPTSTYGYHIVGELEFDYLGIDKDIVHFTIHLHLGGDIPNAI